MAKKPITLLVIFTFYPFQVMASVLNAGVCTV
jgi:hypothetical protein